MSNEWTIIDRLGLPLLTRLGRRPLAEVYQRHYSGTLQVDRKIFYSLLFYIVWNQSHRR